MSCLLQFKDKVVTVLNFTALLIEHSYARHIYNSTEVSLSYTPPHAGFTVLKSLLSFISSLRGSCCLSFTVLGWHCLYSGLPPIHTALALFSAVESAIFSPFVLQHLCVLLACPDLDVVLAVLNLLYVFSKRSNFISRLPPKKRAHLNSYLEYLAEVCVFACICLCVLMP